MSTRRPLVPSDLVRYAYPRDAQISPDGTHVAFTIFRACRDDTPELPGQIWLADAFGHESRRLTSGSATDRAPRWSPDSRRLVFLSDRLLPGQRQLFAIDPTGGDAEQLTDLEGWMDCPAWSPQGQEVAFLYQRRIEADLTSGIHVEDEHRQYRQVWAVDVETRALHPLTPHGFHVHEFAWSPSGDCLAVIATAHDTGPSGWYRAQLYLVDTSDAQEPGLMRQLGQADRQICGLCWSPDGQQIAFLTMIISDAPLSQGDVMIVNRGGTELRQVTPRDAPVSIVKLDWIEPDRIAYSARLLAGTSFGWLRPSTGQIEPLWQDYALLMDWTVPRISIAGDGRAFATVLERPDTPPQVFTGNMARPNEPWVQITHIDYEPLELGRMELIRWRSADGLDVAGHVVYPVGYQPGNRYPTIVEVHGGPTWSWLPHYAVWWEWWYQYLAGRGYVVLLPNIRGSSGGGTAYAEANFGDLGGGDWQDILSGVDHLIALGLADPDRLGIGGWSYGGYMAAWAITQTNRFKAAVMGAGIANWESYYAQSDIRDWQRAFFGSTPYEAPELHRSRSPLSYITRAKTPTLIVHGQEDRDVPVAQAYEVYVALKELGVDTQLVTYAGEQHPILDCHHQTDLLERIGAWFDRYLKS